MRNYGMLFLLPFFFGFGMGKKADLATDIEPEALYESFTPVEKEFLQNSGYFAQKSPNRKFSELYKSLKKQSLPIYVTTDCVLHTYHILYDYSLRMLEMNYLYAEVDSVTVLMIKGTKELLKNNKGDIKKALLDNLAYFEVGAKLLDPDFIVSKSVEKKVSAELGLINDGRGFANSPIFGYREDYSQYVPRGHYTRNETLKKYFRAMMWYGRISFYLKPSMSDSENKAGKHQTRQALLILEAAKDYFENWEKINSPIVLYVGKSDDLTLLEYFDIVKKFFPGDNPIKIATTKEKLVEFIDTVMAYRAPKIVSGLVFDTEKPEIVTKGMRFFGQKFIPDSYIFQNLVYDKVGTIDEPRLFPNGLDVFAVLGSDRAKDILITKYKENRFLNYESQLEKLTDEFKGLKEDYWYQNLYCGWLYTLKSLLIPVPNFHPAYQDKCLQTGLGSWAELRHDTILYAKQSYTVTATGIMPQPQLIRGFVEPIPDCYKRLNKLVDMGRTELAEKAFLDQKVRYKFEEFAGMLDALQRIAETEIAQKSLTGEDYYFIQNIGSALESIESFPGADYTTETDKSAALIADVHTDPNTKQVFEVGNDTPAMIYVVVDINGQKQLFAGGIYDYYEFLQPMGQRMTDEAWQKSTPKPDKPDWIEFFVK